MVEVDVIGSCAVTMTTWAKRRKGSKEGLVTISRLSSGRTAAINGHEKEDQEGAGKVEGKDKRRG
jgi:hypothetical protein